MLFNTVQSEVGGLGIGGSALFPAGLHFSCHQQLDHLRAPVHAFRCDVLELAVEGEAAGAQVRRGHAHFGKAAAVRSTAHGLDKGRIFRCCWTLYG